jgi:anti-sigma B factor antagonist
VGDVEYVVHPEGELDIATVPALCEEWLSAIDEREPDCFVIDLAAVTFLDSSALSAIVAVRKRQREHGGEVAVVNAAPRLVKIFQMTGLEAVVTINPRLREATSECQIDGHGDATAS